MSTTQTTDGQGLAGAGALGSAGTGDRDTPDVGTPRSRRLAFWGTVVAVLMVMLFQQASGVLESGAPSAQATAAPTAPDRTDLAAMQAGMMVRLNAMMRGGAAPGGGGGAGGAGGAGGGGGTFPPPPTPGVDAGGGPMGLVAGQLTSATLPDVDRFRGYVVRGELAWPNAGAVATELRDASFRFEGHEGDVAAVALLMEGKGGELSQAQRDALVARHGYFGKLALSWGLSDSDPARAPLLAGGAGLMAFFVVVAIFLGCVVVTALVCFTLAMVALAQRKLVRRFVPPMPGGSVFLETVAVFAGCFLLLKLVGMGLAAVGGERATWLPTAMMGMQWLLLGVMFYPLLRGLSFAEFRRRIGLTSGRGVLRELGAGLVGYFALLPLVFVAIGVTVVLVLVWQLVQMAMGREVGPPTNPIVEIVGGAGVGQLVLLFLLATVWAPLVEEVVFRGAMYRHLRGRMGVVLAGVLSALTFGVMHGYAFFALLPVITLGLNFALIREWRGSLVAPIFVHALHNATVLTLVIGAFSLMRLPA